MFKALHKHAKLKQVITHNHNNQSITLILQNGKAKIER
jgi:hypothetical protein